MRLALASLVIVQHSLILSGYESDVWIGSLEGLGRATYGDLAVAGFFALSGYLLTSSVHRHAPSRFLRLRFFRLFPGFWAALVAVAFVIAPAIAWWGDRPGSYDVLGEDSATTYVVRNAALVIFQPSIGTVLDGNPYPQGLDGSFWTLAPEFLCYLGLLILAVIGGRLRMNGWVLPAVTAASMLVVFVAAEPILGPSGGFLSLLAGLGAAFFSGALLGELGWMRTITWPRVGLLAVALAFVLAAGLWKPLGPVVLAAFVIGLGSCTRSGFATRIGTRNDVSYGIYLYHFPIIQLLVAAGLVASTPALAAVGISLLVWLLTLPVAWLSWLLVESPAQRWGRRKPTKIAVATTR